VAIALDGGVPDYGADRPAGQSRLGIFKRQRDGLTPEQQTSLTRTEHNHRAGPPNGAAVRAEAAGRSVAPAQDESQRPFSATGPDAHLVKESFAHVMANSELAMEYFYARLFTTSPETRAMFPMGMSQIRERVFGALARLVWSLDNPEAAAAYLSQLGRDHRKYGVKDKHLHDFFSALLETAAYFSGSNWTPETESAWRRALAYAARTMRSAAAADAKNHPPWWVGEIVDHDRRTDTMAVLTIRPDNPLPYEPGQYVPVQVTRWPRVWRPYSIACAPRGDGLITLHVRAVSGGIVSTALVRHAGVGDTVLLGPARGAMTAPRPGSERNLLCVAGGTGLAPIKAIIEHVAGWRRSRNPGKVTLFVGAERRQDLYDLPDLQAMQSAGPGLEVIPVVSGRPGLTGLDALADSGWPADDPLLPGWLGAPGRTWLTGLLPDVVADVVAAHDDLLENSAAYICGPAAMVRRTAQLLAVRVPAEHLHHDPLPDEWEDAGPVPPPRPAAADFRQSPLFAKFARPGTLP
jgi:NAD(P)H-flavin reductase/hemoglobin-like flavoprotein